LTFAVSIKVSDGIVLASDSASTITTGASYYSTIANVYYNADKIYNLCKGVPIGAMTWGAGSVGSASISAVVKDFRAQLDASQLQSAPYSVKDIAGRLRDFVLGLYDPEFSGWPDEEKPYIGFLVAGYSSPPNDVEEYQIDIIGSQTVGPVELAQSGETGAIWRGQTEAISRLLLGYSPLLGQVLRDNLGVEPQTASSALEIIRAQLGMPLVFSAMPIQDAIDLAEFLVNLTINYSRFLPGAQVVGGPIEVATITKHEGFKWIRRKHFYHQSLNP